MKRNFKFEDLDLVTEHILSAATVSMLCPISQRMSSLLLKTPVVVVVDPSGRKEGFTNNISLDAVHSFLSIFSFFVLRLPYFPYILWE